MCLNLDSGRYLRLFLENAPSPGKWIEVRKQDDWDEVFSFLFREDVAILSYWQVNFPPYLGDSWFLSGTIINHGGFGVEVIWNNFQFARIMQIFSGKGDGEVISAFLRDKLFSSQFFRGTIIFKIVCYEAQEEALEIMKQKTGT